MPLSVYAGASGRPAAICAPTPGQLGHRRRVELFQARARLPGARSQGADPAVRGLPGEVPDPRGLLRRKAPGVGGVGRVPGT
jgi:hypothetical protein